MNLLLSTLIGLSFSVRTPNDDTKPLDYEIAVKSTKEAGKFQYFVKRDWERELGEKYIDTQVNISQTAGDWYAGVKYIDKQSKFYQYKQLRMGLNTPIMKVGIGFGEDGSMMNFNLKKVVKENTLEYKIHIDFATDLRKEIWEIKSELRKYLTKKTHIYASLNKEFFNGITDEQYKVGLGVKF